ncbi:MAG: hypothetical protein WKF28_09615 [Rubrobacteraceae bacterium]
MARDLVKKIGQTGVPVVKIGSLPTLALTGPAIETALSRRAS